MVGTRARRVWRCATSYRIYRISVVRDRQRTLVGRLVSSQPKIDAILLGKRPEDDPSFVVARVVVVLAPLVQAVVRKHDLPIDVRVNRSSSQVVPEPLVLGLPRLDRLSSRKRFEMGLA